MNVAYGPILVVEDVPNILELLAVTLRFKGYPVVTASNGEEAIARIMEQRPALVVTDILMPKMDGFALMQKLRTDPKMNQIPVVFLSATYVTPEDKVMQEEVFGPLLPVLTFSNLETLVESLKVQPSPLALYIFTRNIRKAKQIMKEIPSGGGMMRNSAPVSYARRRQE